MDDKYSMTRNFCKSLLPGDLIMINNTKYFFARLDGDSAIVVREEIQAIANKKEGKRKIKHQPPFWAKGWKK